MELEITALHQEQYERENAHDPMDGRCKRAQDASMRASTSQSQYIDFTSWSLLIIRLRLTGRFVVVVRDIILRCQKGISLALRYARHE